MKCVAIIDDYRPKWWMESDDTPAPIIIEQSVEKPASEQLAEEILEEKHDQEIKEEIVAEVAPVVQDAHERINQLQDQIWKLSQQIEELTAPKPESSETITEMVEEIPAEMPNPSQNENVVDPGKIRRKYRLL